MRPAMDDRGLRNVVGFTLMFAVILTSVGVVSTIGHDELGGMSESERLDNAAAAMTLIADNLEQIQRERATSRANEIDLSGGSIRVTSGPNVTVGASGPSTSYSRSIDTNALQYELDDTTITYENGALFRSREGSGTSLQSPAAMLCSDDRAVVPVVTVEPSSTVQVSGQFATVTGTLESRELLFPKNRSGPDSVADVTDANVTVSSPHDSAWSRYFDENGEWVDGSGDTVRCEDVEAVYIRHVVVSVEFTT